MVVNQSLMMLVLRKIDLNISAKISIDDIGISESTIKALGIDKKNERIKFMY